MSVKTVKGGNVSLRASERGLRKFFSLSGDIEYVQMHSCSMETRDVRLCKNQNRGMLFIILLHFGFSIRGFSSSIEVASSDLNSDANDFSHCTFNISSAYVMKSYFEEYTGLSNIQDFLADQALGSCKMLRVNLDLPLSASVKQRLLIGDGSHRHLSSTIRFRFHPESLSWLFTKFCAVIIIERLPSGVFADPFELQHLHEHGVFNDVAVFGDRNLELPSVLSNRSVVEIHMAIRANMLLKQDYELEVIVKLPLHARYPPLDERGYSEVEFGVPDLFICCCTKGNSDRQCCFRTPTNETAESRTGAVMWRIPSGKSAHASTVSVVTFLTALISTVSIVFTSLLHSNIKLCKVLKGSVSLAS